MKVQLLFACRDEFTMEVTTNCSPTRYRVVPDSEFTLESGWLSQLCIPVHQRSVQGVSVSQFLHPSPPSSRLGTDPTAWAVPASIQPLSQYRIRCLTVLLQRFSIYFDEVGLSNAFGRPKSRMLKVEPTFSWSSKRSLPAVYR